MPFATTHVDLVAGETLKIMGPVHVDMTTSIVTKAATAKGAAAVKAGTTIATAKTTAAAAVNSGLTKAGSLAFATNKAAIVTATGAKVATAKTASLTGGLLIGGKILGTSIGLATIAPIAGATALAAGSYWYYNKNKKTSSVKVENIWPF